MAMKLNFLNTTIEIQAYKTIFTLYIPLDPLDCFRARFFFYLPAMFPELFQSIVPIRTKMPKILYELFLKQFIAN